MKLYMLYGVLVLPVLGYSPADATNVKFGSLCSSNLNNNVRGDDHYGRGNFGAPRKGKDGAKRKHKGLDIVCDDGSTIYAPFDVKLNGKSAPYGNNNAIDDGITLNGQELCFKLFYVKPDKYSGSLKKGQKIGTLLPMQKVYPGITSHVHVQMCDESDPTKYF
ncbi:leukocyte cell-derived chemotaxin-2-like [Triplophysa rosa]|uniref:Myeloid protein-1 n=1 Tax=Triplophysa rosa TaxID=992332 RepID=A0A9W7WLD9_TRIRA|nr:leukocyte cell-derived chemotaxin-2-like [Triplophysa rosa]KAI7801828.1 myeloid protein-1 [Triplophysa rosa]